MLSKSLMFQKQSQILPASMAFGLQTLDERYKLKTFVDECLLSGFSCLNLTFCASSVTVLLPSACCDLNFFFFFFTFIDHMQERTET